MGFKKSQIRDREYANQQDHPKWIDGPREKECEYCKRIYSIKPKEPYSIFLKRKFCGKECIRLGQKRYSGSEHPRYKESARRRNRGGSHAKWVRNVLSRDFATCKKCGAKDIELHAHHIKSYAEYPELRFDVDNGITLCFKCHWLLHTAQNEKAVNSVDTLPDRAEGNTEPSLRGNLLEGVTTRGRAYRRWQGQCDQCSIFITKQLSDTKGKTHLFCSRNCATKFLAKNRTEEHKLNISKANSGRVPSAETRKKMSEAQRKRYAKPMAVISSTSAASES